VSQDLISAIITKSLVIFVKWLFFLAIVFVLPPLLLGVIRKTKAGFQGRIGALFHCSI
jgi:formate hydrogenlyase subunit 4